MSYTTDDMRRYTDKEIRLATEIAYMTFDGEWEYRRSFCPLRNPVTTYNYDIHGNVIRTSIIQNEKR